jgi:hypothetical protein
MAAIKKPTKLKYPKKPKASASNETMEKYLKRVNEIDKENRKREADYKSELAKREQLKKKISKL